MDRTIFLIDMDAYFASVEQASNPFLKGKPVIVCGKGRTIVAAASYEARAFGIKTGMNLYDVARLCPQAVKVYGNHDKYIDTSFRIHKILLDYTDQVEVFSVDECFLDVTHLVQRGFSGRDVAAEIQQRIRSEIGLGCSIGIGPNKLVAKLGSNLEKPNGLVEIKQEDIASVFEHIPLQDLQGLGIGRKLAPRLETLGIRTAGQLGSASPDMMSALFGRVGGYHLGRIGRGEDDSIVKKYWEHPQAKSVGHSHTLPQDTWSIPVLQSYLRLLSEKVGKRLREGQLIGRTVDFVVRSADFTTVMKQRTLQHYIKHGKDIYTVGWSIFKELLPLRQPVRLVGITVSGLMRDMHQQYLLEDIERQERLTEVLDSINEKYGDSTIKPSSVLIAEKFGIEKHCGGFMKKKQ